MMNNLPHHLQDAALQVADSVECLQGERRMNAEMIAVAVAAGIHAAKTNTDIKTNGDWADAMCQLAFTVKQMVKAS